MSNIGNYGVNPGSNVGYNNQNNNNYQVQPQNNQGNNGYGNDGYAFNLSSNNNAPVPDVKVGFWDKITTTFDDVHRSQENLSKFKAFESAMSQNPGGYLKPGSSETTRVRDLQKKLSFVGFNVNVNGEFGSVTEKAVINFKKSVGINDGYLTKSGQFAVTSIVTPQMWNILNSQVATRLNPGANPSNGYAAPITKEELDWAKQLQSKIRQYGYNPTQSERQKYESIFQRQQMNVNIQNGSFNPTSVQAPTREELEWAKGLIVKMSQNGYKPSAQEQQRYSDIQKRQQISKNNTAEQNNNTQQNNSIQQPPPVSQQDYNWAVELMNKVKQGYKASPQEEAKYNDIFSRMQTQNTQQTQSNSAPPSQDELKWASDLEAKVKQGYNASAQERAKYDEIFSRYKANPSGGNEVKPPTPVVKPTDSEIAWAMDLEKRSQSGYQPNQNELTIYNDIASRLEAFNAQQNSASPEEMAWASMMYSKMQGGYKPSAEELGILNNIQAKISGNSQQNNNVNPQQNNNTQNNTPEPQQNNFSSPFQGVNDFSYNNSTISEFRKAFSGASFVGNRVP